MNLAVGRVYSSLVIGVVLAGLAAGSAFGRQRPEAGEATLSALGCSPQDLAPPLIDRRELLGGAAGYVDQAELGGHAGPGGGGTRHRTSRLGAAYELGLRVLLLSATGNSVSEVATKLAEQTLTSFGIPYDHVILTRNGRPLSAAPLALETPQGGGKYYAVVLSSDTLGYQAPDGLWHSALTVEQWAQLDAYEQSYQIRRVALSGYPRPALGVGPAGAARQTANAIQMGDEAVDFSAGMVPHATLDLPAAWQNPALVLDAAVAVPFATYTLASEGGTQAPVAAAISRLAGGRQQMTFFFSQSIYLDASYYLAPLWVTWMTHGVYPGKRRLYLNTQVDDIYLASAIWNPKTGFAIEDLRTYTLTPDDFLEFVRWQRGQQSRFPAGSSFRVELCVNGEGVWSKPTAGYSQELYRVAQQNLDEFNWVSHTFTHADLDVLSTDRAANETLANQMFEQDFIGEHQARFSPHSLVTPMYSGMFNADALRAIYATGITTIVGDNSQRTHWPLNFYHGFSTNGERNGFEGVFVLPRSPTVLPVSAGTDELLVSFYNNLYGTVFHRDSTADEIFTREAKRVARLVLSYRYDLYMFHQANLWTFPWPQPDGAGPRRVSLFGLWTEYLARELAKTTTLPILSAKMDDVAQLFKQRDAADHCGFEGGVVITDHAMSAIVARSERACQVPVTGVTADDSGQVTHELYGPDRTTWLSLGKNDRLVVKLSQPIAL